MIRSLFTLGILFSATAAVADDLGKVSEGERLFALRIKPLLAEKCLACHGATPDEIEGGLDLRSREGLLAGGDSFEKDVVILGEGERSILYRVTTRKEEGYEMPPKEADRLSEEQHWWIRDWIDAGAPWPSDERVKLIQQAYAAGEQVLVSRALNDAWQHRRYESEKLWAYRPLQSVSAPDGHHPVDWFLDRKLNEAEVSPAPPADAQAMIRRLSFGLTGLPPTPAQVKQFSTAYQSNPASAIETMAEQLMSSAHYGEQFGAHWLDVVRYADTAGFANDYSRPHAWRYRDYVVRAFNDDKPYNEFVRQQIAGDEIDEANVENLIATGFLRMGPWEQTGMSVFKETRGQWLDDVTDTVGQAFLAHSMLCCKCHDHKFDPVPTRDYYRLMAVFSTTQFAERDAAFGGDENLDGFQASDAWVEAKIAAYQRQQQELKATMDARRKEETLDAKVGDNGLDPGDEASAARMSKNISRHEIERDRTQPIAMSVYTGATVQRNNVSGRIELPKNRWKGEIEQDAILSGGNVYSPTEPVSPGALSAAESLGQMRASEFPSEQGKRRLALADWIVEPSNPLTARVLVNRVWSWHFGRGIAGNPNNFGGTGGLPTHPELLDYLATWFMDNGWSIKKLNRLIVTSQAYSRASRHPNPSLLVEKDPAGILYATFQPRRLTAEELRDAMLVVSGELNPTAGGIPCRPDINTEVAFQPRQIMGGTASVYEPDPLPAQRNRRTLYAERIRGLRDPFLEAFNQPGPDKSCELRETSTVAPQALTLINSLEVFDRSIAFAARVLQEHPASEEAEVIRLAFQLALGRQPSERELMVCLQHWQRACEEEASLAHSSVPFADQITRTVMAEKTGQPYDFVEFMPAYTQYEPDLGPSDVDARTRGLAHVCLVLLNTNEFSYLD